MSRPPCVTTRRRIEQAATRSCERWKPLHLALDEELRKRDAPAATLRATPGSAEPMGVPVVKRKPTASAHRRPDDKTLPHPAGGPLDVLERFGHIVLGYAHEPREVSRGGGAIAQHGAKALSHRRLAAVIDGSRPHHANLARPSFGPMDSRTQVARAAHLERFKLRPATPAQ
jgi:hypothetical protein